MSIHEALPDKLASRPACPILDQLRGAVASGEGSVSESEAGRQKTRAEKRVPLTRGLSARLLLLTISFIMLTQTLLFLPSLANFRLSWLEERLSTAAAIGIVLMQSNPAELSQEVQDDVLIAIGAMAIAVRDHDSSQLLAAADMPRQVDLHVDLSTDPTLVQIYEALYTLFFGGDRVLRIFAPLDTPDGEEFNQTDKEFELVMSEAGLRRAMIIYARNVALLSLALSVVTAILLYYTINRLMARPIRLLAHSMLAFAQSPEDPARIIRPSSRPGSRQDEIGLAERELAVMQTELQRLLAERRRLADLGLAVSKINHDMRNILSAAQLMSDRLAQLNDSKARSLALRLVRTLDRAISYSQRVLDYGRTQEQPPMRRRFHLHDLVEEIYALFSLDEITHVELINAVPPDFEIDADSDQLFRVLLNLARNAVEAMAAEVTAADNALILQNSLTISARHTNRASYILIEDTGPGLPQTARDNLFRAFHGSTRSGGTGLGLAIAHELVRAHGGTLELIDSHSGYTAFSVTIPDLPSGASRALPPL